MSPKKKIYEKRLLSKKKIHSTYEAICIQTTRKEKQKILRPLYQCANLNSSFIY